MAMNKDHFHTHDNFKIAGKIIDQVSALKQRNAELEKENAALKAEIEMLKNHIANGDVSRITWIDEVAELKEERRWRKYPDEKPEWGKEVLVLADDGDIRRVRFSCDYKWISWGNMRTCESSCITHWMPQPKAPEDK